MNYEVWREGVQTNVTTSNLSTLEWLIDCHLKPINSHGNVSYSITIWF